MRLQSRATRIGVVWQEEGIHPGDANVIGPPGGIQKSCGDTLLCAPGCDDPNEMTRKIPMQTLQLRFQVSLQNRRVLHDKANDLLDTIFNLFIPGTNYSLPSKGFPQSMPGNWGPCKTPQICRRH